MFGFNMIPAFSRPFNTEYHCYSVSMLPGNERQDVERGGKIIMPPSALDHLTRLNIVYPMLFKLTNKKADRITHCGVLEFIAEEGKVYLPYWMMHNLLLEEGDLLNIESVSLPVATFSKFQPQSSDFLDITNPKAVLENGLRSFACLTTNDVIAIKYNKHIYELCVLECKPGNAVSIIECDMNVDFAPPLGYKDPCERRTNNAASSSNTYEEPMITDSSGFVVFAGLGNRLDGKQQKKENNDNGYGPSIAGGSNNTGEVFRGIPDLNYKIGTLRFIRNSRPANSDAKEPVGENFQPFSGEGQQLSKPRGA